MAANQGSAAFDYIVIGSGFGGSVAAMRLAEKGYRVLVLERGKRFEDEDFATTNWHVTKYLWAPALRCFGVLQISPFKNVWVLHGSGVGGGSLGYANVLMQPDEILFANPAWKHLADWKNILLPHYDTARRMLGVTPNPQFTPADEVMQAIAREVGNEDTFRPTEVGVLFAGEGSKPGDPLPDPYFDGAGPERRTCNYCGACMVGCRVNAKNTLTKNYLYFAEKWGAEIRAEAEAHDVQPLPEGQPDGARYEVAYHRTTAWLKRNERRVRGRNVVFAAGTIGTLKLLFHCRDETQSLPEISPRLGDLVRTNSEALMGVSTRERDVDYSKGVAITSIFMADPVTAIEPVRYPDGSSLMRFLSWPLVETSGGALSHLLHGLWKVITHPLDLLRTHVLPGWARYSTIVLVMQTEDNFVRMRPGRDIFTLFRRRLVTSIAQEHPVPAQIESGHRVTRSFAKRVNGIPAASVNESLLNIPMTAHILGGVPIGRDADEGVVGLDCQVHKYPGLYVADGAIMPANPGVNPSLTITALAEYAMSLTPPKPGAPVRAPLGVRHVEEATPLANLDPVPAG
jgi:cholesterol oxidase